MKLINFIGSSLDDLRIFPEEARKAAGFELYAVQRGLDPRYWKPVPGIGRGVKDVSTSLENGALSTWQSSKMPFMFFIHFRRRLRKQVGMILKLLESVTNKLEGNVMKERVTKSSGNIFLDLGFPPEEAAILQMRAEIMADLRKFITNKKLTQAKAAELFGVSQSRVSDLIRDKWEKFSLEMLISLATKAGMRISLNRAA